MLVNGRQLIPILNNCRGINDVALLNISLRETSVFEGITRLPRVLRLILDYDVEYDEFKVFLNSHGDHLRWLFIEFDAEPRTSALLQTHAPALTFLGIIDHSRCSADLRNTNIQSIEVMDSNEFNASLLPEVLETIKLTNYNSSNCRHLRDISGCCDRC